MRRPKSVGPAESVQIIRISHCAVKSTRIKGINTVMDASGHPTQWPDIKAAGIYDHISTDLSPFPGRSKTRVGRPKTSYWKITQLASGMLMDPVRKASDERCWSRSITDENAARPTAVLRARVSAGASDQRAARSGFRRFSKLAIVDRRTRRMRKPKAHSFVVVHKTIAFHEIHTQNHCRWASISERPEYWQVYDSRFRIRQRNSCKLHRPDGTYA